ncbi:MAG: hypothetical protein O3C40_20175 [Planctomycetota bacterium]|nr:hypothetical protein [Planctomycetota bacterium]
MSHSLQPRIHAIARRARRLLVVHGLCWFAAVVVSVAFVFGWVDYSLRLQDRGVRIILSCAFGLTLLWSLRHFVVPSIRRHFSDLEVAQHVERRFPQLGDRLSSSLEFLRGDNLANRVESASLQQTVISETEALVQPLDLHECLDPRATRRSLLACIPLLIAIGILCAFDPDATSRAARRLATPWSHDSWPRWNSLALVKPPTRIALGQDFAVEVTDERGRLPKDATLQLWFDGDDEAEVETAPMRRGEGRFEYTRGNVTRSFKYRAIGGDDDSMGWHSLQVIEPAKITDFLASVRPPAYSGIASTELNAGPIRVLAGSQLVISGRTDRPVQSVRGYVGIGDAVEAVDATVDANASAFTFSSWPTETVGRGQYWIELIEADGVVSGSDTRAAWEVIPDQAPTVAVTAPASDMYCTPNATVLVHVTATDDLAIRSLELQIGNRTIPLFAGSAVAASRDDLPAHADGREITRELDLGEFQLAPNDSLEFVFVASDYKPQTSEPVTRSITIISRDDFDYRSQEKQKLLLGRLVEALRLQRATRFQVELLQTQLKTAGTLADDDTRRLRASDLQQQQVARLLDKSPGGAAQIIAELLAALSSNGMVGSDAASRMERLSETLDVINRERLPDLQSEFVRALKAARIEDEVGDDAASLLASVGDRQDAIADDLQSMIDQLAQWDDYRRFARDVAKLLRDQQALSAEVGQLPTIGQRFDTLAPQRRADLERAAGQQRDLARRFDRLQTEMNRLREGIRESDPAASATLSEAIREAGANGIAEQMREIGNDVASNRLGNASQAQSEVEQGLQRVLGALTDSNHRDGDATGKPNPRQLAAALAQLKLQLDGITARQQGLLEATSEWLALGTSSLAPAEMAREQKQLVADTKKAREQLPIPKAFAFGMQSVETSMDEAATRLEREAPGESAYRLQSRSLSRLQQLLAALSSQSARGDNDAAREGPPSGGDESTAGSSNGRQPSLSLEELRLLHAMQVDIYERTAALEEQRQERGPLEDEVQQELQRLAAEQGQLAELLLESLPPEESIDNSKLPASSNQLEEDLDRALNKAGVPGFGADDPSKLPPGVDQRLLDGLDDPAPPRPNSSADIAGEDLGAAKPESTLARLARLMQGVEQRIRRSDTSAATQQLQSDIATELAKMLEAAKQENASRSAAAAADKPSDQTSKTNPDGSEGDPRPPNEEGTDEQANLLDAIWGTLPERLRQQIQSPLQEEFLPRYERVIKQYYKRLAEEQRRLRD